MPPSRLDALGLARVMVSYRDLLKDHEEQINRLNVYPVPDGDTGTNMARTLDAVVGELEEIGAVLEGDGAGEEAPEHARPAPGEVCRAISHGSLMGARGNSGVILCQLLRGLATSFAEVLGGSDGAWRDQDHQARAEEGMDPAKEGESRGRPSGAAPPSGASGPSGAIGASDLAVALVAADEAARKAVLRPVEGTILSVARAAAEGAVEASKSGASLLGTVETAATRAREELARTPELLPVLAQAGVVDAGGAGLVLLFDAMWEVLEGSTCGSASSVLPPIPGLLGVEQAGARGGATPGAAAGLSGSVLATSAAKLPGAAVGGAASGHGGAVGADQPAEERGPSLRYEVMYFLEAPDDTIPAFKDVWAGIGDSIVVVGGDGLWNCHIHTDDVGAAIEAALDVGRPRGIRVSDLAEQVEEERWVREGAVRSAGDQPSATFPPPRSAVVAVANGEGIGRIFRSLGVRHLVPGGQSMNPSTAEMLAVVDSVDSPEVVILPNNDNILPVAMQVCELTSKVATTVPTSGIVEGFAALLEYDPQASAEENAASMAESARRVVAGEVTRAVRDANSPVGPVREGEWIGLSRQDIESVDATLQGALRGLVERLMKEEHELVTLIEGEGASEAETRRFRAWLEERFPHVALEVHHGGQPLYPYLVSIE